VIAPRLFPHEPDGHPAPAATPPTRREAVRVVRPVRNQVQWLARELDAALPTEHPARAIWDSMERLDLSAFYGSVQSVVGEPGRPATDPQVLLALWLFATAQGVGSARRLARLCEEHDAYRWLAGGVPINYHMLSDFRVNHQQALDQLLSELLARLMREGLVTLQRVAQDGTRVRASAGAASFRRRASLERCREEARAQVARLAQEREHPEPGVSARERAARERAARERVERVERALRDWPELQAAKERQARTLARARRERVTEARVSTTDPDARVMKQPDGGYRPAYNAQLATDTPSGVIVGVAVTNQGSDAGQALPLERQVESRTGRPRDYLVDGGFVARADITALERKGVTVYAPLRVGRRNGDGATLAEQARARPGDSPEVVAWRARMVTEEAKAIYRDRAATAEWTNAQLKAHGLSPFTVRGIDKVTSVVLLCAIAHNLLRWVALA